MADYTVTNPATGETVARYDLMADEALLQAVQVAHRARCTWSTRLAAAERVAVVRRVGALHAARREALAAIMVREMGKPIAQALGEVDFAAEIYAYFADQAEAIMADEPIALAPGSAGGAFVRRSALGVILGIMPWNFPLYQVARFAAPNAIVGNPILLKHAPLCPESAAAIQTIFHDAGAPDGAYTNLYASNEQVATLIADSRVQGISLTGSERAGAAVAELAGRHLKKVVLELGGSDAFILLSTDDLPQAVESAVLARIDNNGQTCNAAKRFIVADELYDDFAQMFVARLAAIHPADPTDRDTELGPLSSIHAAELLDAQLDHARAQGAHVLIRGERRGAFVPPAVLAGVTSDMDAYGEEFFGPVAQLYRVYGEEHAVKLANDTDFGLGAYVFTVDAEQAERMADALDVGMVWVNLVQGDAAELPFGGVKRSGFGRELGRGGADEFVNKKMIRTAG